MWNDLHVRSAIRAVDSFGVPNIEHGNLARVQIDTCQIRC
jgi:hypothetical protein